MVGSKVVVVDNIVAVGNILVIGVDNRFVELLVLLSEADKNMNLLEEQVESSFVAEPVVEFVNNFVAE